MTGISDGCTWADDDRVARWLRHAADIEYQHAPVSDVLFAAAELQPGERVLDVGCGTGPIARRAAREVGPAGRVTGLDISADMIAAAAAREPDQGAAALDWVTADAVTWEPGDRTVDVVMSRFGVMFFSAPAVAFTTLAAVTRPGGRLAMVVWARRDECDLFTVPLNAALDELHRRGVSVDLPPGDEGAFSLHDPDTVTALLTATGWSGIRCTPHRLSLHFRRSMDPASAAAAVLDCGPTRLVSDQLHADADRAAVTNAIAAAFAKHLDGAGHLRLDAKILLITADRPSSAR